MNIKEILKKVLNGEELTAEEKQSLTDYEAPDVDKAVASVVARERTKAEKAQAELQSKIDEMQEQLENIDIESGKSELEKLSTKLEKLQIKMEKKDLEIKERDTNLLNYKKQSNLKDIKSKLDLVKGFDADYVDYYLNKATSDLDVDDIAEQQDSIIKSFNESHPQLVKAEGGGTGLTHKPSYTGTTGKWTKESIASLSPSDTLKHKDEIMQAMANGEVEGL